MSSKRQIPHKGQEFSTDDDVNEVEEDLASHQASTTQPSPRIRPLRAQSSTLRRRPSARPSPLTRGESENIGVDDIGLPNPGLDASIEIPSLRESDGEGNDGNDGSLGESPDSDEVDEDEDDDDDEDVRFTRFITYLFSLFV